MKLKNYIRDVPNFPKPGIIFKDITPLLANPRAFNYAIDQLVAHFKTTKPTVVIAAEARGFIIGAPVALALDASFIPLRKPGKLPHLTYSTKYELEYGSDCLEMHIDAIPNGSRVLFIDDVLATGGTVEACLKLAVGTDVTVVGCGFLVELAFLAGRKRLNVPDIFSVVSYNTEE